MSAATTDLIGLVVCMLIIAVGTVMISHSKCKKCKKCEEPKDYKYEAKVLEPTEKHESLLGKKEPEFNSELGYGCGTAGVWYVEVDTQINNIDKEMDHFWDVVRDCIKDFHPPFAIKALGKVTELRKEVDLKMPIEQRELFYHAEPFDVACNLANDPLDVKDYLQEYLRMRDSDGLPVMFIQHPSQRKEIAIPLNSTKDVDDLIDALQQVKKGLSEND